MVHYHLPGLFEFCDFYKAFLPIYTQNPQFFYEWCDIASIYGAPAGCLWGGGRVGFGSCSPYQALSLAQESGISARLTFSNSLLKEHHLADADCNKLCELFQKCSIQSGIIIHSDLLLQYIKSKYPDFYYVSSTTKVLTDFADLRHELERPEFDYVVPDFRLNPQIEKFSTLPQNLKNKVEFLCNECCWTGCTERSLCYQNVSRKSLGQNCPDHICCAPDAQKGYRFSKAMESPAFIGIDQIKKLESMGFSNFKIEGRSLGTAVLLEFILYYMTKPQFHLKVRELLYLDSSLDLF